MNCTLKSMHLLGVSLISVGFLGCRANAALVFNNGSPVTAEEGWDATGYIEADNFSIGSGASITQATIYLHDDPGPWDGTLEYFFYSDSGSTPNSILATGDGQNATILPTGLIFSSGPELGQEIQMVTFSLETPFQAQAGTTYWFGMHLKSDYSRTDTRWAVTNTTGNHHYQSDGAGGWSSGGRELSFELSSIPEPSSALLLGLGLLGVAMRRRRIN